MSELKNPSTTLSYTSLPRPGPGPGLEPAQGGVEVGVGGVSVDDLAGLGLADVGDQADHLARLHRPVQYSTVQYTVHSTQCPPPPTCASSSPAAGPAAHGAPRDQHHPSALQWILRLKCRLPNDASINYS